MKWKTLYKCSMTIAQVVVLPIVVVELFTELLKITYVTVQLECVYQPDSKYVSVNYIPYSGGNRAGYYDFHSDSINIFYKPKEPIYGTIVHELKHADNSQKFSYVINPGASELSARLAEGVYKLGLGQRISAISRELDSLCDSLPNSAFWSPMDTLRRERIKKTPLKPCYISWDSVTRQLNAEKEHLIDSIIGRFNGAIRDSMVRAVEERYSEKSVADKKAEEIRQRVEVLAKEPYKKDKHTFERDFNYSVSDLRQELVDSIFLEAIADYRCVRGEYSNCRKIFFLHTQFHLLNDADLEKLFTYKINGVHRSLFHEASPEIKKQVRQISNEDNLVFMAKQALSR